jgi:methanogenic corrinoid protein MtbC1
MSVDDSGLNRFIEALVDGRRGRCAAMVEHYLNRKTSVVDIYQRLFKPALYTIGDLWASDRLSTASEHVITGIIEGLMDEINPRLVPTERKQMRAVVAAVESERHRIGARMATDVFTINGWHTHYLGAYTSVDELVRIVKEAQPHMVGLSVCMSSHLESLWIALDVLGGKFQNLIVVVGGQALRSDEGVLLRGFPNANPIPDLDALQTFIQRFEAGGHRRENGPAR